MPEDHPQPETAPPGPAADPAHESPTSPPSAVHTVGAGGLPTTLPTRLGRYMLLSFLGKGAMGTVYLAEDTHLNRRVAFKVPHLAGADADTVRLLRDRFIREARLAASLTHPNLCPVHDCGEIDGILYFAMPYLEGKPLAKFIRSGQPLPPRAVVAVVRQLALAMQEAHSRGIIHRDLKPANIMITPTRQPVIMDFGIARRTDAEDTRLTRTGLVVGTPAYMPPEQLNSDKALIGPATDIYALGVILYELLAGRTPFQGPFGALMAQIMVDPPPPLTKWRTDLDPTLDAICGRALAKPPQDRFPSMAAFANALDDYLKAPARSGPTKPLPAPPTAPPRPTIRPTAKPAGPLDEENAATLFNEMAAQQVRLGGTPRPRAVRHHRRRRRRFQLPEWLIPLVGSLAALAVGALVLGVILHNLPSPPGPKSIPSAVSTLPPERQSAPIDSMLPNASAGIETVQAAINELREDAKHGRPPNAIGKGHIENWFSMPPEHRPPLPKDVAGDFARAVILILGDWERGQPLLPLDDAPLWRTAFQRQQDALANAEATKVVAGGDAWWDVAEDERRRGWPVKELRERAFEYYRKALKQPDLSRVERNRISARLPNEG